MRCLTRVKFLDDRGVGVLNHRGAKKAGCLRLFYDVMTILWFRPGLWSICHDIDMMIGIGSIYVHGYGS